MEQGTVLIRKNKARLLAVYPNFSLSLSLSLFFFLGKEAMREMPA